MSDPIRWRDAPDLAPIGVADLLAQAKRTHAIDSAARARTALAVTKVATAPAAALLSAKTVVAIVLAGTVPLVAVTRAREVAEPVTVVAPTRARAEHPVVHVLSVPARKDLAPAAPVVVPTPAPAPPAPTAPAPDLRDEPIALPPPPRADLLAREAALLEAARAALAADPAHALAEANAHAREFPTGQLATERELVAVEALVRLGNRADARARGDALLQRDPRGIYRDRVQALLR